MMHNSFWFDFSISNLLFEQLNINSIEGFLFVCFILIVLAALFEAVKLCQISVKLKSVLVLAPSNLNLFCFTNDQSHLLRDGNVNEHDKSGASASRFSLFVSEVALYVGQVLLGYILMLVVMSYNAYLSLAIIFGAGLGYWFFGLQCAQTRMKMVKLKVPCHHCIQNPREDSAISTLVENESLAGSSGIVPENLSEPSSPVLQTKVEINNTKDSTSI